MFENSWNAALAAWGWKAKEKDWKLEGKRNQRYAGKIGSRGWLQKEVRRKRKVEIVQPGLDFSEEPVRLVKAQLWKDDLVGKKTEQRRLGKLEEWKHSDKCNDSWNS